MRIHERLAKIEKRLPREKTEPLTIRVIGVAPDGTHTEPIIFNCGQV